MIAKFKWLALFGVILPAIFPKVNAATPTLPRLNIVFILCYGDMGAYGGGALRGMPTPNFDRLTSQGLKLISTSSPNACRASPLERDLKPTSVTALIICFVEHLFIGIHGRSNRPGYIRI